MSQGHAAGLVDAVVADPIVWLGVTAARRQCFREGPVKGRWGRPVRERAVWSAVVVLVGEDVDQGLEFGGRTWLVGLGAEPFLHRLLEPFTDLAGSGGGKGLPFFWFTLRWCSSASKPLRPRVPFRLPPESRVVNTVPLSVSVEAGVLCVATALRNSASTVTR